MSLPNSRRPLRTISVSLARIGETQGPKGSTDAPSTGPGRWMDRRLIVEPELFRLDFELGTEDGHGVQGMTLIWVHADPRPSGATAAGTSTLSN